MSILAASVPYSNTVILMYLLKWETMQGRWYSRDGGNTELYYPKLTNMVVGELVIWFSSKRKTWVRFLESPIQEATC